MMVNFCVRVINTAILLPLINLGAIMILKYKYLAFVSVLLSLLFFFKFENNKHSQVTLPSLTPWQNIGGCGAGGSGGGAGDGIKWIGKGVTGGYVDLEMLPRFSFGQNFQTFSFSPRFSFKPTYTTTMGVSIPISSKSGEVQFQTNRDANDRTTGGLGDIGVDISKAIGSQGEYSFSLALTLPTGQYDIKRGADATAEFLPSSLQKGSGLFGATLTFSRTIDVEDGMWLMDIGYSNPFNMRPFSGKNEMLDTYFKDYINQKDNKRFYYKFKPYGENDLGAYTPPSVSMSLAFADKKNENFVQSWGLTFGAPIGVAWIAREKTNIYDPFPDPSHKAWSAAFAYGLEFSHANFPTFFGVSVPIHDKSDDKGKWDAPDWSDFLEQWTFALGMKATLF